MEHRPPTDPRPVPRPVSDVDQLIVALDDRVVPAHLRRVWEAIVNTEPIFRESLAGSEPLDPCVRLDLPFVDLDWRDIDPAAEAGRRAAFLDHDRRQGIRADVLPLLRVTMIRWAGERSEFVLSIHPDVLDAAGQRALVENVFAGLAERGPVVGVIRPAGSAGEPLQTTPSEPLSGAPAEIAAGVLPIDQGGAGPSRVRTSSEIDETRTASFRRWVSAAGLTLKEGVHAAWSVVLSRYLHESVIHFIDMPAMADDLQSAGRRTGLATVDVEDDWSIDEWAARVAARDSLNRLGQRHDFPAGVTTAVLVEDRLAQSMDGIARRPACVTPLLLEVEGGDTLRMTIDHDPARFAPDAMVRMLGHLGVVVETLGLGTAATVGDLEIMTTRERDLVLNRWRGGGQGRQGQVHRSVEQQAARMPHAVAVEAGDDHLTYNELNRRANQVARFLAKQGVEPGDRVGVLFDRVIEFPIALLGILKANAAFVAVDPAWPAARIATVLSDAGATMTLTRHDIVDVLPQAGARSYSAGEIGGSTLCCLDELQNDIEACDDHNLPDDDDDAERLAYVLFTSGSTGRPNGVMVRHRNLLNHGEATARFFELSQLDRVLQFASPSFDLAYEEIFPTWIAGATLVLGPQRLGAMNAFAEWIDDGRITVANLTTALWHEWVAEGVDDAPATLRLVVVGGEAASPDAYQRWRARFPHVRWINTYGPTEATITATLYDPELDPIRDSDRLPIGIPLENVSVAVVDRAGRPVPVGVDGELLLGGAGVALGYHNRPELQQERFVADPLGSGEIVYRTGDRVRWRLDGMLEFEGRLDDQIKIRGHRIEPGGVEGAIEGLAGVARCAVVVCGEEGAARSLAAFVVPDAKTPAGDGLKPSTVREQAAGVLPAFMMPARFVVVARLPLTPSGKVDRRALRSHEALTFVQTAVDADCSPVERQMLAWCRELLASEAISLEHDFFEVGGHSLMAARLFARIERRFGLRLPLDQLEETPTLGALSAAVEERLAAGAAQRPSLLAAGTGRPIFGLPGIGGDAIQLRTLAETLHRTLDGDRSFYGLSMRGTDGLSDPQDDIGAMADGFIEQIRSVQPTGPYAITGFCFGAVVAYEIARRLEASGETLELVGLIDYGLPQTGHETMCWDLPSLWRMACNAPGWLRDDLLKVPPQTLVRRVWGKARRVAAGISRSLRGRRGPQPFMFDTLPDASALPPSRRLVLEAHDRAMLNYRAAAFGGRIDLFRATTQRLIGTHAADLGWSSVCSDVHVHQIRGFHQQLLQEPGADVIAAAVAEVLPGTDRVRQAA